MSRALALALAMAILALLLATPHGDTQAQDQIEVKIEWIKYINPTEREDFAYGVCVFGDYIAVVGRAEWNKPYVALLRKSDGGVVREWIGSEQVGLYNCISIGGKLYAIGHTLVGRALYGVIYVFDVDLNILAKVRSESPSAYLSLAYDGKALYIGGLAYEDVNGDDIREQVWLVEKRDPNNLSLIASRSIYLDESWLDGWIADIGVEPSTGRIWTVGRALSNGERSLIVVLDSNLRDIKVIDYPKGSQGYLDRLYGIAFDGEQYAYILGWEGIAKFSVDGELVAIKRDYKIRDKIVYGYGYLYVFRGGEIGGYLRHVLDIHDTNLNVVKSYVLSERARADSFFDIGRPALEGNNIYVAGGDDGLGSRNKRIVVYSLSIEGVTITTTTGTEGATAVTTATTPVATAITVTTTIPITQTTTVTVTSTTTVIKTDTITMSIPITATITTTAPIYITIPTTITASEGASTQLIVAGLAAIGVALAAAFLLLKRR